MDSKSNLSEEELLEGCRKNDRALQEQFYKLHFDALYGICLSRIKDKEEAMLVVNNAFLRVFKKIELYNGSGSLGAWMRRILFNAISDYYRSLNYTKNSSQAIENINRVLVLKSTALSDLYYEDIIQLVNQLPETTREVFTLFAIDGYPHSDIAEILNIPEGSSKWQLHQARKILKAKLLQSNAIQPRLNLKT
nr:RNA polymerase sigma factor [Saprospiraceae bacterium]